MFTAKQNTASPNKTASIAGSNFIQPKLAIGKSNDKYEVEADAMADKVVAKQKENSTSFIAPATTIQKKEEVKEHVQEKPLAETISPVVQLKSATAENKEEETIQKKDDEIQRTVEKQPNDTILGNEPIINNTHNEVVQQKADEELKEEEAEVEEDQEIQKKTQGLPTDDATNIEQNLNNSKGKGSAMDSNTKSEMESGFGADFSGVSIHTDSNAVQMSQQLGAQAFTSGNDIYFNEGKYNPQAESGKHLLAHELTHTIQQGASGMVQNKLIQKTDETATETGTDTTATEQVITPSHEYTHAEKGTINTQSKTMSLPSLPVPAFKATFGPTARFTIPKGGFPRNNDHMSHWERDAMSGTGFTQKFTDYAALSNAPNLLFNNQPVFYLTLKGGSRGERTDSGHQGDGDSGVIFGTMGDIKQRTSRPYWTDSGAFTPHDVDHKREIQIGGAETETDNMWMLESSANRSSGGLIKNSRKSKIEELMRLGNDALIDPPQSYDDVKANYDVTFENGVVADNSLEPTGDPDQNWELSQIKDGDHLDGLKFLTEAEVEAAGLRGSPDELLLFTGLTGGIPIRIPWDEAARSAGRKDGLQNYIGRRGGARILINSVIYTSSSGEGNQGGSGSIICTAFPGSTGMITEKTNLAYTIRPMAGISYGGYIESSSVVQANLHALNLKYMSPITLPMSELDDDIGLKAEGTVMPSIPLIGDTGIELVIDERGARFRKLFQKNDYNFPGPFEISDSTLEVYAGTEGFGINGEMNFKINHVGEGFLRGNFSTERGFALAGGFNFDSQLFDPASIEVSYENEILTVSGTIGIPEGKIQGVKSATITATYSENTFTATGEAELDVPGIQRGTMEATYNEEGFSIGGEFQLRDDIPGIRGGSVSATISKQNGEEGYGVMISGTAQPDIPGIDTSLTITYDNGALTIEGSAAYTRGMLSGTVQIGATNRAIGEDGTPLGEPDSTMRVYGGGSLTLTLTPWLQATAGVRFLPNGELEITGRIGLPDSVDIFDRRSIDRNLFNMPAIEIPIFAIPLGPRSLGVVARITGGLDFSAGFGPGQIRSLYADVTYNPDREDETTISGHGEFVIPADAGLTLHGDLGLGVSIGIASLTGGIEVAGSLGLEGEALAQVDVNWSPQTGLAIDALGRITVNPKFVFDINAFARASLDLWLVSISETWRYNLASFSWGPDIQFGIEFPINYREGEPFDISFDDLNVIYPELDIGDMLTDLGKDVKDDIF